MTVARRWLRDRRRALIGWCLGMCALVLVTVAFFPTVEGDRTFEDLTDRVPEGLRSVVGLGQGAPVTTAPGYLHARLFSTLVPLLLVVYAIGLGARSIAGTEEDGTLELLLAQPVTRTRVAWERYLANAALLAVVSLVFAAALVASAAPFGALDRVSPTGLAGATAGATALAQLHGSIAFATGAATGRRGAAIAAAATVAVAGYLVEGLLGLTESMQPLREASPWHWYLDRNMLVSGAAPAAIGPPLLAGLAIVAVAGARFSRRDLR